MRGLSYNYFIAYLMVFTLVQIGPFKVPRRKWKTCVV
jgi:hypothetical protein